MTKPVKNSNTPKEPVKVAKSEKEGFGSYGARLRVVRESLGLSRPKFADLLGLPETTLKNYELAYRQTGIEVSTLMEASDKTKPYINYVLFGKADIGEQLIPVSNPLYDPYTARGDA